MDDQTALELALIENLQREDLDPIEESKGYAQLMDQFDLTQEEVATRVGKNRATVANALRLAKLPVAASPGSVLLLPPRAAVSTFSPCPRIMV